MDKSYVDNAASGLSRDVLSAALRIHGWGTFWPDYDV